MGVEILKAFTQKIQRKNLSFSFSHFLKKIISIEKA